MRAVATTHMAVLTLVMLILAPSTGAYHTQLDRFGDDATHCHLYTPCPNHDDQHHRPLLSTSPGSLYYDYTQTHTHTAITEAERRRQESLMELRDSLRAILLNSPIAASHGHGRRHADATTTVSSFVSTLMASVLGWSTRLVVVALVVVAVSRDRKVRCHKPAHTKAASRPPAPTNNASTTLLCQASSVPRAERATSTSPVPSTCSERAGSSSSTGAVSDDDSVSLSSAVVPAMAAAVTESSPRISRRTKSSKENGRGSRSSSTSPPRRVGIRRICSLKNVFTNRRSVLSETQQRPSPLSAR
eukprot:m.164908 g.164908  ORF g.164908 m.164908 type:complete len:302 (-) comp12489_c0_seq1:179-1084(-)